MSEFVSWSKLFKRKTFSLLQNIKWKINIFVCKTEVHSLKEISKRLSSVLESDSFPDVDFARQLYAP